MDKIHNNSAIVQQKIKKLSKIIENVDTFDAIVQILGTKKANIYDAGFGIKAVITSSLHALYSLENQRLVALWHLRPRPHICHAPRPQAHQSADNASHQLWHAQSWW